MSTTPALVVQRRRLAVALGIVALIVAVLAVLLAVGDDATGELASGAGLLLGGLLTGGACAWRASVTAGRRRRSWLLLTTAAAVAVLGNLYVTAMGIDTVADPSAVYEASLALALLISIVGLLNFPSVRRRGLDRLLLVLDGLIMGVAVLVIVLVLVYPEVFDGAGGTDPTRVTNLLLIALDIALATVALLLVLRSGGPDRPPLALVSLGFLLYAGADLTYTVLTARDDFAFGSPLDLGWIAGYFCIGLAALVPSDVVDEPAEPPPGESDRGTFMVYGVLLVAAFVQVGLAPAERLQEVQTVLWGVLIVAAGTRQTLLTRENTALRRGLERRVGEQTADLRRLVRQTEVLLDSVGDGIYGVDESGRIRFVNPSAAALLGYAPEDLDGREAHGLFHAPDAEGEPLPIDSCYITEAIRDGAVASSEEDVYVRADGTTFPVEITASPLVDDAAADGRSRGAVVAFRDVTQRREVDRMKNEFLSVVSHELRTPLTSIRGSLGLLAGGALGELPPRAGSLVGVALQSSERLTRLINDILDLERIESGTRPLEVSTREAADLVRASVEEMAGMAAENDVAVHTGTVGGRVLADRDRVVQTLTNLLNNAIKYSDPGGQVVVSATERAAEVVFEVRDTGRGIPADKLESVFDRFEQVDSSDARQRGGTGLGLAISRGIVERHGGRIWAESVPGAGTVVRFTLPSAIGTTAPAGEAADHPDAAAGPEVLVCDDDPATVRTLGEMLRRHGYRTVEVSDGEEAVRRVRDERPAAVLLDVLMPGTSGAEVLAALKGSDRTGRIPVVIVSILDPDEEPAIAGRSDGWLVKPVSEERLLSAVEFALSGRLRDSVVLLVEDDLGLAEVVTTLLAGHGVRVVHAATAADAIARGREVSPQVVVLDLQLPDADGSGVVAAFRDDPQLADTALVVYSALEVEAQRRGDLQLGETVFLTKSHTAPQALEERVLDLLDAATGLSSRRWIGE